MSDTISWEAKRAGKLHDALMLRAAKENPAELADIRYQYAIKALDHALVETIGYMRVRNAGQQSDRKWERELSSLWMEASRKIIYFDDDLADACAMKGLGWTDPAVWVAAKKNGLNIGIEDMSSARMLLTRHKKPSLWNMPPPSWFPIAGVCFSAITILFLMFLLLGPVLDPQRRSFLIY